MPRVSGSASTDALAVCCRAEAVAIWLEPAVACCSHTSSAFARVDEEETAPLVLTGNGSATAATRLVGDQHLHTEKYKNNTLEKEFSFHSDSGFG